VQDDSHRRPSFSLKPKGAIAAGGCLFETVRGAVGSPDGVRQRFKNAFCQDAMGHFPGMMQQQ